MPTRITGMYSGLDTESLIQELVKARSKKVEKLNKDKTKLEWKTEKWKDLNKKISSFYSGAVSNLRWATSFKKKTTSVSNTNAVSVITGEGAMNAVQKLSITKLAQSGYLTGAKVGTADDTKATKETLVSNLKFGESSFSGTGSFNVTVNGNSTTVNIGSDTTISSVVSQLNAAGVNANFDEANQRLFIGATQSGFEADFTITANDAGGNTALSVLGINASPTEATTAEYAKVAGYSSYLKFNGEEFDADATITAIQDAGVDSDIYKRLMKLAKSEYQKTVSAQQTVVNEKQARVTELEGMDTSAYTEEDLAVYNSELETAKAELETEKAKLDEYNTNLNGETYSTEAFTAAVNSLKNTIDYAGNADTTSYNTEAIRLTGSDAEIELNGATFTSATNNVTVNGLTFTCNALAENITVTTQDDTDGIYDMVKNFIKEYNEIINEIDSLYNADSTKIEPLTDEERDAVSDTEAEKLEKQVKDSLLRRDSTLGNIFNGLKSVMQEGIEVGDETIYLSHFGISSLSYFTAPEGQKNALHIDGNADDADVSGNADKLKTMIASDPDTVVNFFTQLGKNLYTKMSELSASSENSTFGVFYEDKKLKKDLSDYTSKISKAEQDLQDYEDKYYDKFAAMEVALSKMDSKNSYISSLFSTK